MKTKTEKKYAILYLSLFIISCFFSSVKWIKVSSSESLLLPVSSVLASSYEDPNIPENSIDGDFNTRWSAEGDSQWIQYDLGSIQTVSKLHIVWYNGDARTNTFDIEISSDSVNWNQIYSGISSGTTNSFEVFDFTPETTRYVRYIGHGNSINLWNSIVEVEIYQGGDTIAPASPTGLNIISIDFNKITLGWDTSSEIDFDYYKIYRGVSSGFTLSANTLIGTSTTNSYVDIALCSKTSYFYVITVVDINYLESDPSYEASGTTLANSIIPPEDTILHVDFNNWNQGLYTESEVDIDWNSPSWTNGVNDGRTSIITDLNAFDESSLSVDYPQGGVGPSQTGAQWQYETSIPYDDLYCSYRLMFREEFDFVKGGKIPGMAGGARNTGGNKPTGTDGWSARMMWRTNGQIVQYVYHPDQVDIYGEDMPWQINSKDQYFQPGIWYLVEHRVKMNTPGQHDGVLQTWLNGEINLDVQDLRWRDVDTFSIDCFYFSTFFGGSDATWAPTKDEKIDYDEFIIATSPITHQTGQDPPPVINHPEDIKYVVSDLGNSISWIPEDNNPDYYIITQNNIEIDRGSWSSRVPIIENVDGLIPGEYIYEIIIYDTLGQSIRDSVYIFVDIFIIGDVNGDDLINIIDALMIAQYDVGLDPDPFPLEAADVNNDGIINIIDALLVAQYYVELIPSLPPP